MKPVIAKQQNHINLPQVKIQTCWSRWTRLILGAVVISSFVFAFYLGQYSQSLLKQHAHLQQIEKAQEERKNIEKAFRDALINLEIEKSAQYHLREQLQTAEGEIAKLRRDLTFFTQLRPHGKASKG